MYSAYAIANEFIRRAQAGRLSGLNSMKLQKLMYFTQAWHLRVKGRPLFDDTFIRGDHGPVLSSIHHQLKRYDSRSITQTIRILSGDDDREAWGVPEIELDDTSSQELVEAIIDRYGELSGRELSALTHLAGSAWSQGGPDRSPLTNESIGNDPTL